MKQFYKYGMKKLAELCTEILQKRIEIISLLKEPVKNAYNEVSDKNKILKELNIKIV